MGRLAKIAGAKGSLQGKVTFTDAKGFTHVYDDEGAAEKAMTGREVFHFRGAFYEEGCKPKGYVRAAAASAPAAPEVEDEGKRRRRRES